MSFTFPAEIGSENNSSSFLYFPFENLVTNISIFRYTSEFDFAFFGQEAKVHRTVELLNSERLYAEVNGTKTKSLRTGQEIPHKSSTTG